MPRDAASPLHYMCNPVVVQLHACAAAASIAYEVRPDATRWPRHSARSSELLHAARTRSPSNVAPNEGQATGMETTATTPSQQLEQEWPTRWADRLLSPVLLCASVGSVQPKSASSSSAAGRGERDGRPLGARVEEPQAAVIEAPDASSVGAIAAPSQSEMSHAPSSVAMPRGVPPRDDARAPPPPASHNGPRRTASPQRPADVRAAAAPSARAVTPRGTPCDLADRARGRPGGRRLRGVRHARCDPPTRP